MPEPAERGTRRRPAEVRRLVVDAATQTFSAKGFDGATTAEIAGAAGVSESTLFRHFPTKLDLFTAAAVEPFEAFMEEFAAIWARHRGGEGADLMREFVTELYDNVAASRQVVGALLMTDTAATSDVTRGAFTRLFADLQEIGEDWQLATGANVAALEVRERIVIGMVTSMVLFDRWLLALPDGSMLPRETVIEALIAVARYGAAEESRDLTRE